jgi:hypothetical protein
MQTKKTFICRAFQAAFMAAIFIVPPQSASALLCLLTTPLERLAEAKASAETYRVYLGRLDANLGKGATTTARFTGHQLGPTGFETPASLDMKLQSTCWAGDCGSIFANTELVIFAQEVGGQQVVRESPCGGSVFAPPDAEMLERITACFRDEGCSIDE